MSATAWFLLVLLALLVAAGFYFRRKIKRFQKASDADRRAREERLAELPTIPLTAREEDCIYQWSSFHGERLVGRAVEPSVDEASKEVHFLEITHSDYLLLPDECQFGKYTIEIHTVEDAVKEDKSEPEKGRILRDVTASITGYVEQ